VTRSQLPLPPDLQRHPELIALLPLPVLLEIARRALIAAHAHLWNDPETQAPGNDSTVLHLVGQLAELTDLVEDYVSHTLDDDDDSVDF